MILEQVGRTKNSVTINVSGMTTGDRQTYIYMPGAMINSSDGGWFTLQVAKANGYISDFVVANLENNNGDIRVILPSKYYSVCKTVDFCVQNVSGQTLYSEKYITAILQFDFSNSFPKRAGEDIDITVSDMKEINNFGRFIDSWIGGGDGMYYPLTNVSSGDSIRAVYLSLPAENILNAAYNSIDNMDSSIYSFVCRCVTPIVDNCVSGADFEASFFNGIYNAINGFNIRV